MKKMKLGQYEFRAGKYQVTPGFELFEIRAEGPGLWLDIDWTDDREFPVGWCAALNLGSSDPHPARWHAHWSWNAPHEEPNRLNFRLGGIQVDFSCFTWWETVTDSVETGPSGRPVVHVHYERCFPYLEDGWPLIRVRRTSGAA